MTIYVIYFTILYVFTVHHQSGKRPQEGFLNQTKHFSFCIAIHIISVVPEIVNEQKNIFQPSYTSVQNKACFPFKKVFCFAQKLSLVSIKQISMIGFCPLIVYIYFQPQFPSLSQLGYKVR